MVVIPLVVLAVLLSQQPETMSLLDQPLYAPSLSKAERAQAEERLATTRAAYEKTPNDPAAILGYEQAVLTLGRVGDALEILTHGLETNHDEPRLLLERGRNYIRIRKFAPNLSARVANSWTPDFRGPKSGSILRLKTPVSLRPSRQSRSRI